LTTSTQESKVVVVIKDVIENVIDDVVLFNADTGAVSQYVNDIFGDDVTINPVNMQQIGVVDHPSTADRSVVAWSACFHT